MKIINTEIYLYKIPMIPFTIATGTMQYAQNILIKIHTDEGIIGWGECSAFPMIVGETQLSCYNLAKDFAAFWLYCWNRAFSSRKHTHAKFLSGCAILSFWT